MVQQVQYDESIRQDIMQELMPNNASTEVCFKAVRNGGCSQRFSISTSSSEVGKPARTQLKTYNT